jgi:hypothetical protein
MDGHTYTWQWSNVPFASSCTVSPIKKAMAIGKTESCSKECAEAAIACFSSALDNVPAKACMENLDACSARCAGR